MALSCAALGIAGSLGCEATFEGTTRPYPTRLPLDALDEGLLTTGCAPGGGEGCSLSDPFTSAAVSTCEFFDVASS